jgi:hypothetical protein
MCFKALKTIITIPQAYTNARVESFENANHDSLPRLGRVLKSLTAEKSNIDKWKNLKISSESEPNL